MRLDKFLKESRIIKRRTVAKEVISNGYVYINGTVAKPSAEVRIGDVIELVSERGKRSFEVMSLVRSEDGYVRMLS